MVLFSAGEASGDAYAGALIDAVRELAPDTPMQAVGGTYCRAALGSLVAESSNWGAVGITEALRVAPRVWGGFQRAKAVLRGAQRGVFVPIDYGYMNIRLCREAKAQGWKVLYFIPPGSWRKDRQGADLVSLTDRIVTPFPWSAEILQKAGADAHFLGHPLLSMVPEQPKAPRQGVVLMPGSRGHEVEHNLRPLCGALMKLGIREASVALAPNVELGPMAKLGQQLGVTLTGSRDRYALLQSAQAALICSGTATLEAALCGCPCVVVYRGSWVQELEYKIRKPKFDFIALPNLILGRRVVEELIQHDATAEAIGEYLGPLLSEHSKERAAQLEAFASIKNELQPSTAIQETAPMILELMGNQTLAK